MEDVEVFEKSVFIGRWNYIKPNISVNENGEIVLIHKLSFGPAEWWKWGIDVNGKYFMQYRWCEDDIYEDDSFRDEISKEKMIEGIHSYQELFKKYGLTEYVNLYMKVEDYVNSR